MQVTGKLSGDHAAAFTQRYLIQLALWILITEPIKVELATPFQNVAPKFVFRALLLPTGSLPTTHLTLLAASWTKPFFHFSTARSSDVSYYNTSENCLRS